MRLPSWICNIVNCWCPEYPHHVSMALFTHILPGTLDLQVRRIVVKTEELLWFEVSFNLELNDIFSFFDFIGTDYQSATILSVLNFLRLSIALRKCKCQLQALVWSCHQFRQRHLGFTDEVFVICVIIVEDLKMQVNVLDKVIPDVKVLDPLRVEVIVDDLGLTIILPRSMFN